MGRTTILSLLALATGAAVAQVPADAETVTGDALNARLAGRTFHYVVPNNPATFRLQYNDAGYVFLNGPNNLQDSAAYRIEGSRLCSDWKRIPAGCSEVRVKGDVLHVQRSDGSWGTMTPR